jgi:hypothetical protein
MIAALALLLLTLPVSAADESVDKTTRYITTPDIPEISVTVLNETALEPFHAMPTPITIIHVEVSETSLPGPRYMAFGPTAVDVSMSPVVVPFIVLVGLTGVFLWGLLLCRQCDAGE